VLRISAFIFDATDEAAASSAAEFNRLPDARRAIAVSRSVRFFDNTRAAWIEEMFVLTTTPAPIKTSKLLLWCSSQGLKQF
jgi:hypothetical protein